jgi:hypothetical protein
MMQVAKVILKWMVTLSPLPSGVMGPRLRGDDDRLCCSYGFHLAHTPARQNAFMIMPQHHHAMTQKFSRNDRAAHQSLRLQQQHGAERMNLKLLATAAAVATFAATGAQAQTTAPSPNTGVQQKGSVSGSSGPAGQRLHEKGSAKGTVGSATETKRSHSGAGMKPAAPGPSGRSGTGAGSEDEN